MPKQKLRWAGYSRIRCNCGDYPKDHYMREGQCNKCGCTWYYPNDKYLAKKKKEKEENMPSKLIDMSLKKLKVIYECQDKGEINEYFDKEIRELGKKYGIKWNGQGMTHETGLRDISFGG